LRAKGWLGWIAAARAWLFLALLLIFFEVWARASYGNSFLFNLYNLQSITIFAVAPLLLALGQTLVIISGGIDLSVGFVMGLAAVVTAHVTVDGRAGGRADRGGARRRARRLVVAAIPGLINGVLIARPARAALHRHARHVWRGARRRLPGRRRHHVPVSNQELAWLGNGTAWIIPMPVLVTIIIVAGMHYTLSQSRFGQHVYAIGGNRQAARRSGIEVSRNTLALYVIAALCAAALGRALHRPLHRRCGPGGRAAAARFDRQRW